MCYHIGGPILPMTPWCSHMRLTIQDSREGCITWPSRGIWKSIRQDSESPGAATSEGMRCTPFLIHHCATRGTGEALEGIGMRAAQFLIVPQIVHPKPVVAPVTFLVYFDPPSHFPSLPFQSIHPRRISSPLSIGLRRVATRPHAGC